MLKPCPFCGQVPELVDREKLFVFRCPETSPCFGSGIATYGKLDQREEAIAIWNTREDTALPLREVLDSVTYALIGLHVATGKKSDTADKAISQAMALLHPDTKGGE